MTRNWAMSPVVTAAGLVVLSVLAPANATRWRPGAVPESVCDSLVLPTQPDCTHPTIAWAGCYGGGYNATDATAAVRGALNDTSKPIVALPAAPGGGAWPVLPLTLRGAAATDRVVVLQSGAVLEAVRGAYKGKTDALLTMNGASNVTLCGAGAVLRMWRADYNNSAIYNHSEWRHGLSLWDSQAIVVDGPTIELTGGDGVYVHSVRGLRVRGVLADQNYRQGMSITDASDVVVERCTFSNTRGTAPMAGIDLEPNAYTDKLDNVLITGTDLRGNSGADLQLWLGRLNASSTPINVTVDSCTMLDGASAGLFVGGAAAGLRGTVNVRNSGIEGTAGPGVVLSGKSAAGPLVALDGCRVTLTGTGAGVASPIELLGGDRSTGREVGGFSMTNSQLVDGVDRPWLTASGGDPVGTSNVTVNDVSLTVPEPKDCNANLSLPLRSTTVNATCHSG